MKYFGTFLTFITIQICINGYLCLDHADKNLMSFADLWELIKDIYMIIAYYINSIFTIPGYWMTVVFQIVVLSIVGLLEYEVYILFKKTNALYCFQGTDGAYSSVLCQEGSTHCQTMTVSVEGISSTAKSCSNACSPQTSETTVISCCETDNCNGPISISTTTVSKNSGRIFSNSISFNILAVSAFVLIIL
ncbi:unnamed protein product [Brachionus calyciflorus]|uniref:Snake toxin/toxin-like domain-containing protein n=1 Tax=Brachionus calyciflorus TaxID=104777 RepID=A0A814GNJ4_9BILA|nr:unnamed protein product [Brachionus calyciflorus]